MGKKIGKRITYETHYCCKLLAGYEMSSLTGLEEEERQDKRQREEGPLPSRQLGQGLFPHRAKRHLDLESPIQK